MISPLRKLARCEVHTDACHPRALPRYAGYALVAEPLVALPASRPRFSPVLVYTHACKLARKNGCFLRLETRDTCIPYRLDTCNALSFGSTLPTPLAYGPAPRQRSVLVVVRARRVFRCNNNASSRDDPRFRVTEGGRHRGNRGKRWIDRSFALGRNTPTTCC